VNFGLLFREQIFFTMDISYTFCQSVTKFGDIAWGLANQNLVPEFREVSSGGPVIPCGDMHQSFTGTLESSFSTTSHVYGVFSVLSIHSVARGLGASFLYKCPASRGGSLRKHGLLVKFKSDLQPRLAVTAVVELVTETVKAKFHYAS